MNMFAAFWNDVRTYVDSNPKAKLNDDGDIRGMIVNDAARRRLAFDPAGMHIGAVLLDLVNLDTNSSKQKHMKALANHIKDRYKSTVDNLLTLTALSEIVSLRKNLSFLDVVRALCLSRLKEA